MPAGRRACGHRSARPTSCARRSAPTWPRGPCEPCQLHPVVPPQVSHFRQVPLRTRVKLPHSPQASPSYPLALASARFSAGPTRACARPSGRAKACCCSSCSVGESFCSGSDLSATLPEISARASRPPKAVTFEPPPRASPANAVGAEPELRAPPSPTSGEDVRASSAAPPGRTESLSVRERVSPRETYLVEDGPGLPSTTPLPSASKPPSVGSTWARSKRSR